MWRPSVPESTRERQHVPTERKENRAAEGRLALRWRQFVDQRAGRIQDLDHPVYQPVEKEEGDGSRTLPTGLARAGT